MDKSENSLEENAIDCSVEISKLLESVKEEISKNVPAKECKGLILLKEKCCSKNVTISSTACYGILKLVNNKILTIPQSLSLMISLFPSTVHVNPLVSAIGNILIIDLNETLSNKKTNTTVKHSNLTLSSHSQDVQHPLVIILKSYGKKSWFEIYTFISDVMEKFSNIKVENKIQLLRPVFHYVFESPDWTDSQLQTKLFHCLISKVNILQYIDFTLEILTWKKPDVQYCLYLKDLCTELLNIDDCESKRILPALNPYLAESIKWIIQNGYNPGPSIALLKSTIQDDDSSLGVILFILTDVILETPPPHIVELVDICKLIICSASCNRYVASKFIAVALYWFAKPSSMVEPVYKTLEEILFFIEENPNEWNDRTDRLLDNMYFKRMTSDKIDVKFAAHIINVSNFWNVDTNLTKWLENLMSSNDRRLHFKIHSFIFGIILCEKSTSVIDAAIKILFQLINSHKEISFGLLCLLFYKLARESEPVMQYKYLSNLPKLAVNKDNIPLIVGIIESLNKGDSKKMGPLVVQLFLILWKSENRTYTYLHRLLHENPIGGLDFELTLSKALALKEICRLAPHLHAKDVVGVLSRVLNDWADHASGLPSAIAIEAIVELCKALVIDVTGTWNALQPTLKLDRRPRVVIALCRFFGEIPNLSSSGKKNEQLVKGVVGMLWNYTFMKDSEVANEAYRALSQYEVENLDVELLPEEYRVEVSSKDDSSDSQPLTFVPPECWLEFLDKINGEIPKAGGCLVEAIIERELNTLPRGLFYLPPEKPEPSNYSYLPQKSVCRVLMSRLLKCSKIQPDQWPKSLKEIIRIFSLDYTKLLPPINWGFASCFVDSHSDLSLFSLGLLIKQCSVSRSAKSWIENYLTKTDWTEEKVEKILYICGKVPNLCKGVSRRVFEEFFGKILTILLDLSIDKSQNYLSEILQNLIRDVMKNNGVSENHKIMVAKCLEKVLPLVPPEHEIMKCFASCAAEFPTDALNDVTRVNFSDAKSYRDDFLRSIRIRYEVAMKPEVRKPLNWFDRVMDELEAKSNAKDEKNAFMETLIRIMRLRRNCDYSSWMQELMRKIQDCKTVMETRRISLFLVDMFIYGVTILSGHEAFFNGIENLEKNKNEILVTFPSSYRTLISSSEWSPMQSKMALWMEQLINQENDLPQIYAKAFAECVLLTENHPKHLYSHYLILISNKLAE